MRQPLESGEITVTRVGGSYTYPCRFTLVAAMNPCPCGFFGTDRCRCKPAEVKKYQSKISGPISDRIDLQVTLKPLSTDERFAPTEDDVSPKLRAQVEAARQRQRDRFQGTEIAMNAAIPGGAVMDYCKLSPAALEHYKATIDANTLSTRSMDRLAKVARTAADLAGSDTTEPEHIDAAARFVIGGTLRTPCGGGFLASAQTASKTVLPLPTSTSTSRSLGMICSASSFFPRGIGCLPWFAPPPDSLSGSGAV